MNTEIKEIITSNGQDKTQIVDRDYYKCLFLAQTGKGKTYAARNLPEATTGFINTENKPLPFKKNFKYHARPKTVAGAIKAFDDYVANPEILLVIMDSASAFYDLLVEDSRGRYKNYDIWNNYNTELGKFLRKVKEAKKEVFITGHYEILNLEGNAEKRMKTKGKEWEGVVEKEFAFVMYGEDMWKDNKPTYQFRLAAEGASAKVPPDIFGEGVYTIPNDYKFIYDKIIEFVS